MGALKGSNSKNQFIISTEEAITRGVLFYLGNKLGKVGSSQLENRMNEGLIDAFDKALDHARDKEIGPYKKQL
ncbi:hypothetical protein [Myroides sp. TSA_177.3]|uniref:hypothetical protein n=1 Tax=Myroides sp. TSA_177.3 TaxID=3415650 RepID=UPI004045FE9D